MDPKISTLYEIFKKEEFNPSQIKLSLPQKYKLLKVFKEQKLIVKQKNKYVLTDEAKKIRFFVSYLHCIFQGDGDEI